MRASAWQIRDVALHQGLATHRLRIPSAGLMVETLQAQRQQFRLQLALLLLQGLIAPRGRGLALQVANLLVDLLA
jgi:hypothetical protein